MQTSEAIKVSGEVTITVTNAKTREVVETRTVKNLVVKGGKHLLAHLLAGDAAVHKVDKIVFGTGTADPTVNDTGITNPFQKTATVTTYTIGNAAYNQVMFTATLETADHNSNVITELGLQTLTENTLFSRLKIAPITKSVAFEIKIDWAISFQ